MHTEQKVWSNWSLRQQNYLNYPTFPLVGPLFVGVPVRPNVLNMPKSASGYTACMATPSRRRHGCMQVEWIVAVNI